MVTRQDIIDDIIDTYPNINVWASDCAYCINVLAVKLMNEYKNTEQYERSCLL